MDDRLLLATLRRRKYFDSLSSYVNMDVQEKETKWMLKKYKAYFEEFSSDSAIDTNKFYSWLVQFHMRDAKPDQIKQLQVMLRATDYEPPEEQTEMIVRGLTERELAQQLFDVTTRWDAGEDIDIFDEAKELLDSKSELLRRRVNNPWQQASASDLFQEDKLKEKAIFEWLIEPMNKSIGHGVMGEFYIFGAPPGAGKSTFMAAHVVHWAKIVNRLYGMSRPILLLINEGALAKAQRRIYQCGLGKTTAELIALENSKQGTVQTLMNQAGIAFGNNDMSKDIIIPLLINQYHYKDIERIIEELNPCAIIYDMLDNVKGFELAGSKGTVDLRYELLYQWARDMAIVHDHMAIATSQLNKEGTQEIWPQQSQLKGAAVAKQGACDAIIMMGVNAKNPQDQSRYISTPKEKSEFRDKDVNPKTMVQIHPDFTIGVLDTGYQDDTWSNAKVATNKDHAQHSKKANSGVEVNKQVNNKFDDLGDI